MDNTDGSELVALTADIVSSHVSHNNVPLDEMPKLIKSIYDSLASLSAPAPAPVQEPAVPIKSSVKPDYIVCLEDGKKLKMLKRHLMTRYGMTPSDYRQKWGLGPDYPMVAPNYTKVRRELAKTIGLGSKGGRKR